MKHGQGDTKCFMSRFALSQLRSDAVQNGKPRTSKGCWALIWKGHDKFKSLIRLKLVEYAWQDGAWRKTGVEHNAAQWSFYKVMQLADCWGAPKPTGRAKKRK
jgi:hypothetical protein